MSNKTRESDFPEEEKKMNEYFLGRFKCEFIKQGGKIYSKKYEQFLIFSHFCRLAATWV